MSTRARMALASRIVAACRGADNDATNDAISEVAIAAEISFERHANPMLRALSIADAALYTHGIVDLETVLGAVEGAASTDALTDDEGG